MPYSYSQFSTRDLTAHAAALSRPRDQMRQHDLPWSAVFAAVHRAIDRNSESECVLLADYTD